MCRLKEPALLHDLGKAVDHEVEGPHVAIGVDSKNIGNHMRLSMLLLPHHGDEEPKPLSLFLCRRQMPYLQPGPARRETWNHILNA